MFEYIFLKVEASVFPGCFQVSFHCLFFFKLNYGLFVYRLFCIMLFRFPTAYRIFYFSCSVWEVFIHCFFGYILVISSSGYECYIFGKILEAPDTLFFFLSSVLFVSHSEWVFSYLLCQLALLFQCWTVRLFIFIFKFQLFQS